MEKARCQVSVAALRIDANSKSEMISQMLYGETCEILENKNKFSKIKTDFDNTEAWIESLQLENFTENSDVFFIEQPFEFADLCDGKMLLSLGSEVVFPTEVSINKDNIRESIKKTALQFLNVPFLDGGRSYFGVDADSFVQLVYKIHGIELPRIAKKQSEIGRVLDFLEESEPGDLAFFEDSDGNIFHVGIIIRNYEVIHAYGKVRIDALDSSGIFNKEINKHTHRLRLVKSII